MSNTRRYSPFNPEQFQRDGISYPHGLTGGPDPGSLNSCYLDFQKKAIAKRGRELYIKPHLISTWLDGIVFNPEIIEAVEAAIGPDIVLWSSDFFVKAAGKGTWVSWHQDLPYWNLSTNEVVSVWLAMTPSTVLSGSMRVIPGSHRFGSLGGFKDIQGDIMAAVASGEKTSKAGDLLTVEQDLDYELRDEDAIDVELQPGEWSIHHGNLVHGGRPNQANYDRVGFVMRFVSGRTYCRSGKDSALLVKGSMHHDQFVPERRPSHDLDTAAMKELSRALSYPSGFGDKSLK